MLLTQTEKENYIQALKGNDYSLLIRKGAVVIYQSSEVMLKPLLECLSQHRAEMTDALVVDRVVGRAAALLFAMVNVSEVVTLLASTSAQQVCQFYGIPLHADKIVPRILNRAKTDLCPMEKLAQNYQSPADFYARLSENPRPNHLSET